MLNSIVASHMNMQCDIYNLQTTQTESGVFQRKWIYARTVQCRAEAAEKTRAGKIISQTQDGFYDESVLRLKTMDPISKRSRVTNIRSNDGKIVYMELDKIEPTSTIFEVRQSYTVTDPFGRIACYETLLKRAVVQENDIYSN